jgi:hypothetical protein
VIWLGVIALAVMIIVGLIVELLPAAKLKMVQVIIAHQKVMVPGMLLCKIKDKIFNVGKSLLEMIYKVNVEETRGSSIILVIRAYIAPSLICVKRS